MIQNAIVALIVGLAALYVMRTYSPLTWRTKLVYFFTARGVSQAQMARLLGTGASCGSGCGSGNDGCKACAKPESNANPNVIRIVRR
ncbi:hypothetical protein [Massilia psychrophila]|uniref:Uncharacterized protein n=1 Tax=Massilia psychrophila TaxID=1603353 RepID=A0A2G8T664_9BURK|nr:hypothetical protein [Massilia psychrophila]PIL41536.1 hypothetical protein CR103_00290 [Massilia psychrophila]GGE62465.1 hypothetical protein GCM10008020_03280 [Massilia psychrophila]